jgi:hypothetical protein
VVRRIAFASSSVALLLASAAPAAGATGFTFTAQSRSIAVTVSHSTTNCLIPPLGCAPGTSYSSSSHSDAESAPDYTTFWETARVASFPQSYATQISSLRRALISASGTLAGASDYGVAPAPGRWFDDASWLSSSFSTSFDVDEATPYHLTGSVTTDGDSGRFVYPAGGYLGFGPTYAGHTTTRVTLKTAGGLVIAEGVVANDTDCDPIWCATVAPIALSSVGVLQPGSYVLEAVSTGSTQSFFAFGDVFLTSTSGSYWVTLEASDLVAVPSLSPGGLACLVAALILVSLPTLSRLARVRG